MCVCLCVCGLHCPITSQHVLLHLHPISRQRLGQLIGKIIRTSIIIRKEASSSMTIGLHKSNRSFGDVCSWTSTLSWSIRSPPLTEDQTISMSYWFHSRGCHFSSSESSVSHMQRGNAGRTGGVLPCLLAQQFNIIFQKNVGANQIREVFIILNTDGFSELSCPPTDLINFNFSKWYSSSTSEPSRMWN